jgi:hypothetical protein
VKADCSAQRNTEIEWTLRSWFGKKLILTRGTTLTDTAKIDSLKSNPAVIHVFARYVNLKRDGNEYLGLCPFHSEKTPSFKVYQHDGVLLYKCFGCGEAGNVLIFVQKLDKITFGQAIRKVDEFISKEFATKRGAVESTFKPFAPETEKITMTLAQYAPLETALANSPAGRDWLLKERGITYETARKLKFGYRQNLAALAGHGNADVSEQGWIAMPCCDAGRVVSIKYRSIAKKAFARQPNMQTALFNLDTIDELSTLYVTEGEFDAAILEQAGFRAVSLPSASTKLTPEMKAQITEADTVILAGDCDGGVGSAAMEKLWKELGPRTYLLKWPAGIKDANQCFLETAKRDLSSFRTLVADLTTAAKSTPMPGVASLQESMAVATYSNPTENPDRFVWPWPSVDKMVNLLPGQTLVLSGTNAGVGKTTFLMDALIENALRGEVILNYSAELSMEEYAQLAASYLLRRDKNLLTPGDIKTASKKLTGVRFYLGHNPDLSTYAPVLDLIENAIQVLGATTVVIDHLHFICRNSHNEIADQANAMQRIINMGKKYGVKNIVASQPRKANQQTKGKALHLTDLKGSETLGSDANYVLALHREKAKLTDPLNPPRDPYDPTTEIHLLKGRSLGTGNAFATLFCMGDIARFVEPALQEPPPSLS